MESVVLTADSCQSFENRYISICKIASIHLQSRIQNHRYDSERHRVLAEVCKFTEHTHFRNGTNCRYSQRRHRMEYDRLALGTVCRFIDRTKPDRKCFFQLFSI